MKYQIYISKSNLADPDDLIGLRRILKDYDVNVAEFHGGEYSSAPLKQSDLVIIISYPGAQEGNNVFLGKGTFMEATKASVLRIPILFFNGESFYHYKEIVVEDKNDYQRRFGRMDIVEGFNPEELNVYIHSLPIRPKEGEGKQGIELA